MENSENPQIVSFKPVVAPTRYLAAATDKSRGLKDDYDVRCIKESSIDTYFLLEHLNENIYRIKSAANPKHYLFCSNDNTRKYENDFDVRTHSFEEERNNWIIDNVGWSAFTIRSYTNPTYFLFVANDKSNALNTEFDVRTQEKENDNNHWYIITRPNFAIPYPLTHEPISVKLRPAHLSQCLLTVCENHKSFHNDLIVRVGQANDLSVSFFLDRVEGNTYAIRSALFPSFYLFIANDRTYNEYGDHDVRLHPAKEVRNDWIIESTGSDFWTIRSLTNPNQYLFAIQEESLGKQFAVRAHPFVEERNKWIIEGFMY